MKNRPKRFPTAVCNDGFEMSVQAHRGAYCNPDNDIGPWTSVEIGFPNRKETLLMPFAENPEEPTNTVYGWVPQNILWDVILKHGGLREGCLIPITSAT